MNEAASLIAAAVPAGAAPRPPPPTTIELYVTESARTPVYALEPGLRPAGDDDPSRILDCTIELDSGRLVFNGAKLSSHIGSRTTFAVIGGTGCYAGARHLGDQILQQERHAGERGVCRSRRRVDSG